MPVVATLQLLVDEESPEAIKQVLSTLRPSLEAHPSVLDVRTTAHNGQPWIGPAPIEAIMQIHRGEYTPGAAWNTPLFVLPTDSDVQVDGISEGTLRMRVPAAVPAAPNAGEGDIDLRVIISDEGVNVSLLPSGVFDDITGSENKAALRFAVAAQMQTASQQPLSAAVSKPGVVGRLYDILTGRPIMGPALMVPARGSYSSATSTPEGFVLEGVVVDDCMEEMRSQILHQDPDTGRTIAMFFTDTGELIPGSRVELREPSGEER